MHPIADTLWALNPQQTLTALLYGECRGEPLAGQVAVAWSVRNRSLDARGFPDVKRVALAWAQYSSFWPTLGGDNYISVLAFAQDLLDAKPLAIAERQLGVIATAVLAGDLIDQSQGATHYYAPSGMPGGVPPKWAAAPAIVTTTIGRHVFLKNVA